LYNNGEAEMNSYVMGGQLFELANVTNGLVVAVEHRYYGKSVPTKDFSGASLKYLTVAQALADMAYFIQNWEGPKGATLPPKEERKWITVGGSYPGDLSAWMRLKYPDLVFAAYSSSGPVRAKYDYFEYDLAVGDALGEDCATSVYQAVQYIDSVLDSNNQTDILNLKTKFGLQVVTASNDFGSALADFMSLGVQYGVKKITDNFCNNMPKYAANDTQSVSKIIDSFGAFQQQYMTTNKVKATDYNSVLGNDTISGNTDGSRLWGWQTCLEFAFWQTAPKAPTRRMRSKYIDTNYYESSCIPTYGANSVPATPFIDRINTVYGSDTINMPRIVFINGELDPWRRLSVSAPDATPRQSTLDNPVYIIKGGSHCSDLDGYKANESPSKTEVNKNVKADILRWLNEAALSKKRQLRK